MLQNGFYDLTWGLPRTAPGAEGGKLYVDQSLRYNTLLDALTGNGLYGYGPRATNVGRVEDGQIAEVHLQGVCLCGEYSETFDDTLHALCKECNPQQRHTRTVNGLRHLYGIRFHLIDQEILKPIEEKVAEGLRERSLTEEAGHLKILADPALVDQWIEKNGTDMQLVANVLKSIVGSESILDIHQEAGQKLTRMFKEKLDTAAPSSGMIPEQISRVLESAGN